MQTAPAPHFEAGSVALAGPGRRRPKATECCPGCDTVAEE